VLAGNRPRNALIAVRIAAIEFVAVVESNSPLKSTGGIRSPLEDHLGPVHPHVIVHPALRHHLALGGVPEVVVGFSGFELLEGVAVGSRIGGVLDESLPRPRLGAFPAVVVLVVFDEEDGEFAPGDDLVEEAVARSS